MLQKILEAQKECKEFDFVQGTIQFFHTGEEKRFGFIKTEQGSVFFHEKYRAQIVCDGSDNPILTSCSSIRIPQEDDKVILKIEEAKFKKDGLTRVGLRAQWWGFEDELDRAIEDIELRSTYRLRERNGEIQLGRLAPVMPATYRTIWEGKNLGELRLQYSQRYYEVRDSHSFGRFFERLGANGWVKCDDPR